MSNTVTPIIFDITTRRGRERVREVWTGVRVANCTPEDLVKARTAGYEPDGAYFIGRDPRTMAQDELRAMGHEPMSPMEAIRAKCLDCCAGSSDEVRKCVAMACPSWPFRTGKNPWRAPPSEAQREHARQMSLKRGQKSANEQRGNDLSDEDASEVPEYYPDPSSAGDAA